METLSERDDQPDTHWLALALLPISLTLSLLITFAVKQEAIAFQQLIPTAPGLSIAFTGIGEKNARRAICASLDAQRPGVIISAGFAGGLNPKLAAGTVLFEADHEFPLTPALLSAGAMPSSFHFSDRIIIASAEKKSLWESTGAGAVEMESRVIRAVCQEHGLPSATVRVISDSAEEDLPLNFNQILTGRMTLHYGKLAAALASSPSKLRSLLAFQKQIKMASRCLAEVLIKVVEAGLRSSPGARV